MPGPWEEFTETSAPATEADAPWKDFAVGAAAPWQGFAEPEGEKRSTYEKTVQATAGAAAQTVSDIGTEIARLSDIGPGKASFRRHEAALVRAGETGATEEEALADIQRGHDVRRERLMMPGLALEKSAGEAAAAARETAAATPGNPWVAKAGELVGGMVPFLLAGPAAPAVAGVSSAGSTYNQAYAHYKEQGFPDEQAKAMADKVASTTGLASGELFAALPGFGKAAAERMLANRLKEASTGVRAAVNTLAASSQGSLVMGADALQRAAQAKQTYRPDLTWGEALEEAAKEAVVGGAAVGIMHAPMEAARLLKLRSKENLPAGGQVPNSLSEFGGEADVPTPETPGTVDAQLDWLKQGKRAAVLVTPGERAPAVPEGMETHPTEQGTFIYDPEKLKPEDINQAVAQDRVGDLLDYGIARKPEDAAAAGVVTVRGPDGAEKQAVVTDQANAPEVVKAARDVAGSGDRVSVENAESVINERKQNASQTGNEPSDVQSERENGNVSGQTAETSGSNRVQPTAQSTGSEGTLQEPSPRPAPGPSAIVAKTLREASQAREPIPLSLLDSYNRTSDTPWALPEGYQQQGDRFVFQEPARRETERQRMVREQQAAMAELRAAREKEAAARAEDPDWSVADEPAPVRKTERPKPGTPLELGERPPDILDWIEGAYRKGVKLPGKADFGDYLNRAKGKARDLLSLTKGEDADRVLKAMHEDGLYPRIETPEDLAEAMLRAAESRQRWRVQRKYNLAGGLEPGKVPALEKPIYTEDQIDTAVERIKANLSKDFGAERLAGLQAVEPNLRDAVAAEALGITREAREAFEQAFGVKLVFLIGNENLPFFGMRDSRFSRMLFIDVRTQHPAMVVASHELLHDLRGRSPELYAKLDKDLQSLLKDFPQFQYNLMARYQLSQMRPLATEDVREELYADFLAEQMGRPEFWKLLQNQKPRLFTRLANALSNLLDKIIWRVRGFEGTKWFKDIAQARNVLVQTLGDFMQNVEQGTEPAGTRKYSLAGEPGERATGQKIAASEAISEETKQAIDQYLYARRTNATDDELASGLVQQLGLEGAEQVLRNPPTSLAGATWSRLLRQVTRGLADQERLARAKQDTSTADALAGRQGALWDEVLPKITDQAQALQALNDLVELSPDAQVSRTKQRLERAANEELQRHATETTQMQTALEQGRAAGLQEVRQDPQVNGAAKAAVDEAIAQSEATRSAVVMELAGPWAESPHILTHAREQVRSKANELLNKSPRPPGLTASQHLREILDDLAQRAATIAAGYFQGAAPHPKGLAGLLQERLGLDEAHAGRLAKGLDAEFQKQVEAAKRKLPKRIATQRAARERQTSGGLPEGAPDNQVDAALRQQLRDLNLKLGQVLQQEAGRREATGQHAAERVVEASGLKGEKADTLRTTLKNRWDTIVNNAQVRTLEQLQKRSGLPVSRPYRTAFDKLIQLDKLGALTSDRFYDVVKQSLKLKRLNDVDARELRRLAQRAQDLPEGFMRQRAAAEVLKFTEKLSEKRGIFDLPMSIFYANILSGITTPAKIAFENTNLLVGQTLTALATRPGELLRPLRLGKALAGAYGRGLVKGGLQAADTLRTGTVSGVWAAPKSPSVMEMKPFGAKLEPLNFWKYFGRVIGTSHELTFKPAWEIKQTLLARDLARREGLRGVALDRRVADLLANTKDQVDSARAQALTELQALGKVDRLDLERRAREIIEQKREAKLPGSTDIARDFALRTAYLNDPYGFMGSIATTVRNGLEKIRHDYPWLGTGVKSQIPFTTIVANILNEKLNWTPAGLLRAAMSHKTGELYGRQIMDPKERGELYTKSILGTIALSMAFGLFGEHIYGNGPGDPHKRKQLQAAGWIPHSIEYHGKYYSYMNTPAALGLAVIGNYLDWHRYGKGEDADSLQRLAFATKGVINAIVSQGMLDSLKRLFEALGTESTSEGGDRLTKLAARTGASFVIPNLLQQLDRLFDPTVYDQSGIAALLSSQVPFVRRQNKPSLNVLGEPVQSGPFHYWASKESEDPVWRFIADHQAWISAPSKGQMLLHDMSAKNLQRTRAVTDDEYYRYVQLTGPKIKTYLQTQLPRLQTMDPELVKKELEIVARKYGEETKAKLSQEAKGVANGVSVNTPSR